MTSVNIIEIKEVIASMILIIYITNQFCTTPLYVTDNNLTSLQF